MGKFQGQVLSLEEMIVRSDADQPFVYPPITELKLSADRNARLARDILADGETLNDAWRFGVLQTLDEYQSVLKLDGVEWAAQIFAKAPVKTGSSEVDAAFAALADYLAELDGWDAPAWINDPERVTSRWFPAVMKIDLAEAEEYSPRPFRDRGIFISSRSLLRV